MPFAITTRKPTIGEPYVPPIGVILAWHPRLFSAANNVGVDSADQIQLPGNWALCDSKDLSADPATADSPLINGVYKRLPEATDNRFLMGGISNTHLGDNYVFGGTNHAGPPVAHANNGDNSLTIGTSYLPPHTHPPGTLNIISTITGDDSPDHSHAFSDNTVVFGSGAASSGPPFINQGVVANNTGGASTRHQHPFTVPSANFAGATADGGFANDAVNVLPKYLLVKYIMRIK